MIDTAHMRVEKMSKRELRLEVIRCRRRIEQLEEIAKRWVHEQQLKQEFDAGCE